jgi:large subunit ribosomal protein L4e
MHTHHYPVSTTHTLAPVALCRNLPGVEVSSVERLNLLQLAPGGHMGRFVIFTKSAFDSLDKIFGEHTAAARLCPWMAIHQNLVPCVFF